ncbi:unnamed protein product [Trichobilharzia regenti]|nr:unnamed protein product [Trichobilharzia regenti]
MSKSQCECLNEDDSHSLSQLLNSPDDEKTYLLSDTDEQVSYLFGNEFMYVSLFVILYNN